MCRGGGHSFAIAIEDRVLDLDAREQVGFEDAIATSEVAFAAWLEQPILDVYKTQRDASWFPSLNDFWKSICHRKRFWGPNNLGHDGHPVFFENCGIDIFYPAMVIYGDGLQVMKSRGQAVLYQRLTEKDGRPYFWSKEKSKAEEAKAKLASELAKSCMSLGKQKKTVPALAPVPAPAPARTPALTPAPRGSRALPLTVATPAANPAANERNSKKKLKETPKGVLEIFEYVS